MVLVSRAVHQERAGMAQGGVENRAILNRFYLLLFPPGRSRMRPGLARDNLPSAGVFARPCAMRFRTHGEANYSTNYIRS
jgi:hypothetical protein